MNSLPLLAREPCSGAGGDLREMVWVLWGRVSIAAAGAHVVFLAVFLSFGLPLLVWVNVGSVAVHLSCSWLSSRRHHVRAIVLLVSEVLLHAAVAERALGPDSGFQFYILTLVLPLLVTLTGSVAKKLLWIAATGVYYGVLDAWTRQTVPFYAVGSQALDALRYFNLAGMLVIMAFVSLSYAALVTNAERALRTLASTDPLTGLHNRRRMLDIARRERIDPTRRHRGLCVLLCDIDHFKRVNDGHGHDVGDRVLYRVGQVLSGSLRDHDSVARWGGEEFLALVIDADLDTAAQAAERMRHAVAETRIELPDRSSLTVTVTVTIGVARLRDGDTIDSAIARADAALYRGKATGRNRVSIESEPACSSAPGRKSSAAVPDGPVERVADRSPT